MTIKRAVSRLSGILMLITTGAIPGAAQEERGVEAEALAEKIVVAHRGASGYLPEHTLSAKAMAYAMGTDFIEQDVVMSRDDQLLVLHDVTLDRTTDVGEKFPGRARADGRHYVVDFDFDEIRQLRVFEASTLVDGVREAVYPERFPVGHSNFRIHTLAEEIELIQGLNRSTGRNVGIYPEVKAPAFHREEGKDLSSAVVEILKRYGYTKKTDKVYLQTFDFDELKRLHDELLPSFEVDLKLVQLIDSAGAEWMLTAAGLNRIARYADGIGPEKAMIISADSTQDNIAVTEAVAMAHTNELEVHPYTFRLDTGQVPSYAGSFEELLKLFFFRAGVDGVFTDFPDRAVDFLKTAEGR